MFDHCFPCVTCFAANKATIHPKHVPLTTNFEDLFVVVSRATCCNSNALVDLSLWCKSTYQVSAAWCAAFDTLCSIHESSLDLSGLQVLSGQEHGEACCCVHPPPPSISLLHQPSSFPPSPPPPSPHLKTAFVVHTGTRYSTYKGQYAAHASPQCPSLAKIRPLLGAYNLNQLVPCPSALQHANSAPHQASEQTDLYCPTLDDYAVWFLLITLLHFALQLVAHYSS